MRRALTLLTVLGGVALGAGGLLLALPSKAVNPHILLGDPGMPFASGLFLIGIMLLFGSAVVYNIVKTK